MGKRRGSLSVDVLFQWIRRQSMKVKMVLGAVAVLCALGALQKCVKKRYFYVASKSIHAVGIMVLVYKLTTKKSCSGLSLKSQELTAIFLAARLCLSLIMSNHIHTMLDLMTLVSTLWVIYMIRYKLKSTYNKELDNLSSYKVVVPCAILALLIHSYAGIYPLVSRIIWAFCVYLEAVSVLPQLRLMQNAKMVEPFTSHYVFALGVSRFLGCAHWIFQIYESGGRYLLLAGRGYLWIPMLIISELVQTCILADFCYYYIKSVMEGQLILSLSPSV